MTLPNAENAFIDDRKLIDYCLSESHPIGKHKAKIFKSALGLSAKDFDVLKTSILSKVFMNNAIFIGTNQYGNLYVLDMTITNFPKQAVVRTSWIVKSDENFPRLTSCYVIT